MSMTWGQIRQHWLNTVGNASSATTEAYDHLTEGYRSVAANPSVRVPELAAIDESLTVSADADYVAMSGLDFDTYAVLDVFNVTQGYPIDPEPGGMTGRRRYLDTTGKPPAGVITHYQRDGVRLYVRNTPEADTVLRVRVQRQVPTITVADINTTPLTPAQYDWAIVYYAASNYYSVHPRLEGENPTNYATYYAGLAREKIGERIDPRVEEDRPHRKSFRVQGYNLNPRVRWGR